MANLIDKALREPQNEILHNVIRKEIAKLSNAFPTGKAYLIS